MKDRFLKEASCDQNGNVTLRRYKMDADELDISKATPDANINLDLSPLIKEPTWYDETDN